MGGIISSSGKRPEAILWDLDGTLIDTSRSSIAALNSAIMKLTKNKMTFDHQTLLPIVTKSNKATKQSTDMNNANNPQDKLEWATKIISELQLTTVTPKLLVSEWDSAMLRNRASIPLMPFALETVRHFHRHKIPQAICTMSNAKSYAMKKR